MSPFLWFCLSISLFLLLSVSLSIILYSSVSDLSVFVLPCLSPCLPFLWICNVSFFSFSFFLPLPPVCFSSFSLFRRIHLYLQFVRCTLNVVGSSCFFALISSRSSWSEDGSSVGLVEKKRSSIPLRSKSIKTFYPRTVYSHSSSSCLKCLKLKDNFRKFRDGWIIYLWHTFSVSTIIKVDCINLS